MNAVAFTTAFFAVLALSVPPDCQAAEASKERVQIIQTSPGGVETRTDVRFATRPGSAFPEGREVFGGGRGTGRDPHFITRFSVKFYGTQLPPLPARAFDDLNNPKILEGPTWLPNHDHFELHFPGGSGEKFYEVTFQWSPKTRLLSRVVERRVFGSWESQWRLKGGRWQALRFNVHHPEEQ